MKIDKILRLDVNGFGWCGMVVSRLCNGVDIHFSLERNGGIKIL